MSKAVKEELSEGETFELKPEGQKEDHTLHNLLRPEREDKQAEAQDKGPCAYGKSADPFLQFPPKQSFSLIQLFIAAGKYGCNISFCH